MESNQILGADKGEYEVAHLLWTFTKNRLSGQRLGEEDWIFGGFWGAGPKKSPVPP